MVEETFSCDAMVIRTFDRLKCHTAAATPFSLAPFSLAQQATVAFSSSENFRYSPRLFVCCNLFVHFRNYQWLYFRRQRPMRIQQRIINRSQILVQCHNHRTNTVTRVSTCEPHPQSGYLISWFDCHPHFYTPWSLRHLRYVNL